MYTQQHPWAVPVLRAGDDLEDVLANIQRELSEANRRAAAGDTQAAARAQQLEVTLADTQALAAGGGTAVATRSATGEAQGNQQQGNGTPQPGTGDGQQQPDELTRLRDMERRYAQQSQADAIAERIAGAIRQQQQQDSQQLEQMVQERVTRLLSGDGIVTRAVREELAQHRGTSRFAEQQGAANGGTPDLDALAAGNGGGVEVAQPQYHAHATGTQGDLRGLEHMRKNKPLGHMIRAMYRVKANRATALDHAFFQECMTKALAEGTPSAGGALVPLEYMPDVLGLLRAQAILRRAGITVRNFMRQVDQLSVSSGSVAYYTPENAQGQISELTFGQVPVLTRHNLMGLVPVSNILLQDVDEAERIVREDMAEVMALREDLAFLRGTGAGGEPTGLRNKAGVTLDPIAVPTDGFTPSIYDLRRIRAEFRQANLRNPRPMWFFNSAFITYLETLADTLGRPLLETPLLEINDDGLSGRLDGLPFMSTNQIPINLTQGASSNATDLMLVDLNLVRIGTGTEMEIDVSTEATYWDGTQWVSTYQNNQSLFRSFLSHDIALLRPQGVIVQRGVLV